MREEIKRLHEEIEALREKLATDNTD
jgi:hypothetical protein